MHVGLSETSIFARATIPRLGVVDMPRLLAEPAVAGWDRNAAARLQELITGSDPAYADLVELAMTYTREHLSRGSRVLDVGCGLGFLTSSLAVDGFDVWGVDPSAKSIALARQSFPALADRFYARTLESFEEDAAHSRPRFDAIVANMVLHSVDDLAGFFRAAARLLTPGGFMWAAVPNPDTYLQGRSDIDVRSLDLTAPQVLPAVPFRIHGHAPHPAPVPFYHRPFRDYSATADVYGLRVADYRVPDQVGTGRRGDIAIFVFTHSSSARVRNI
jgi:SAM-dependent methyltransferase